MFVEFFYLNVHCINNQCTRILAFRKCANTRPHLMPCIAFRINPVNMLVMPRITHDDVIIA